MNMNWPRIILDGLSMSLLFNAVVGLGFLLVPQAYSTMFPKEIKEATAPYEERKDVRVMHLIVYSLYLVLVLYWAVSAFRLGFTNGLISESMILWFGCMLMWEAKQTKGESDREGETEWK